MTISRTPNAMVDIFRGVQFPNSYPVQGQTPAATKVRGYLKHHLQAGRFGYQDANVKWTHLLLLDPGVDIRSAYDSWTGPAEATAMGDTVLLQDCPRPGNCCAFYVVMVQRAARGTRNDHLRVYLDRLQPRAGDCYTPGVQFTCGSCTVEPSTWTLALGGDFTNDGCDHCAELNRGVYALNYLPPGQVNHGTEVSNGCYWQSDLLSAICSAGGFAGPVFWQLRYLTGITFTWELQLKVGASSLVEFAAIPFGDFQCLGPNTFTSPDWSVGTCLSATTATITRAA